MSQACSLTNPHIPTYPLICIQASSHLEHPPLSGLVMSSFSVKNILSLPESCLQSCSNTTPRVPNTCQGVNLSPDRPTGSNCVLTAMPPSGKSQDNSLGRYNAVTLNTLFSSSKFHQEFLLYDIFVDERLLVSLAMVNLLKVRCLIFVTLNMK